MTPGVTDLVIADVEARIAAAMGIPSAMLDVAFGSYHRAAAEREDHMARLRLALGVLAETELILRGTVRRMTSDMFGILDAGRADRQRRQPWAPRRRQRKACRR
jgi:hypothetical protein